MAAALLLFPTKALAQDQSTALKGMLLAAFGEGADEWVEVRSLEVSSGTGGGRFLLRHPWAPNPRDRGGFVSFDGKDDIGITSPHGVLWPWPGMHCCLLPPVPPSYCRHTMGTPSSPNARRSAAAAAS